MTTPTVAEHRSSETNLESRTDTPRHWRGLCRTNSVDMSRATLPIAAKPVVERCGSRRGQIAKRSRGDRDVAHNPWEDGTRGERQIRLCVYLTEREYKCAAEPPLSTLSHPRNSHASNVWNTPEKVTAAPDVGVGVQHWSALRPRPPPSLFLSLSLTFYLSLFSLSLSLSCPTLTIR